jgi:hypothetical protein
MLACAVDVLTVSVTDSLHCTALHLTHHAIHPTCHLPHAPSTSPHLEHHPCTAVHVTPLPPPPITGASSGLGLAAATELAKSGNWHVIMACRDFSKAEMAAKKNNMPAGSYSVMHLDLASMSSVRQFVANYKAAGYRLDALVRSLTCLAPLMTAACAVAAHVLLCMCGLHLCTLAGCIPSAWTLGVWRAGSAPFGGWTTPTCTARQHCTARQLRCTLWPCR